MIRHPTAPPSVWRPVNAEAFLVGVPHYPEHVDESHWDRDAQRMAEAGFNAVRMAEFAWHLMEPSEGVFDVSLFERAIEGLARHGLKTILCTPTATPPRWLTAAHPEVLRVDGQGRRASHGSRQHADPASPVYRMHSRRITRTMAERFRDNPHVIGWQTDNELNTSTSVSYSDATLREFQVWLSRRYGTIGALNAAWGGDFWATAYRSFEEVVLPLDAAPVFPGPGHVLDFHRFLAFATARFQAEQVAILRAANPDWFVFHNLGRLDDIDLRDFAKDLDVLGCDLYPLLFDEFQRTGSAAHAQALYMDQVRAASGNVVVPEQQSGLGSQPGFSTMTPEPGEMRRMAMASVARGADGLMFFRWRPAHFGAEIYWMGLVDHDDVPRRRYAEARRFAGEMRDLAPLLLGTRVRMDVGIAGADFDNGEAHRTYPMGLPSPLEDAALLHRHCFERGIPCGFIHPEDDLSPLKLLYVPHWTIWRDEWTERLRLFAEGGGTVVLSALTGTRDAHGQVIRTPAPGPTLGRLAGVAVEEFGRLAGPGRDGLFEGFGRRPTGAAPAESASRRYRLAVGNQEVEAGHLYEALEPSEGTETLGRWSSRWLEGRAAATLRGVGAGRVAYLGTYLTPPLLPALLDGLMAQAGAAPLVPDLPAGVEASLREGEGRRLLFLLNGRGEPADVPGVPRGEPVAGDGERRGGGWRLPPHGCAVLRLDPQGA